MLQHGVAFAHTTGHTGEDNDNRPHASERKLLASKGIRCLRAVGGGGIPVQFCYDYS